MSCHACLHGDCPRECPDDLCRNGMDCECTLDDERAIAEEFEPEVDDDA